MYEAIEKMRKSMTMNKEADLDIESLVEDYDMHFNVKREEYEGLIQGVIVDFQNMLKEALAKSGLSCSHIDSIELVGEATRIPAII